MTDRLIIRFSGGGLGLPGQVIQRVTGSKMSHVEHGVPWRARDRRLIGALPWKGVCWRAEPDNKDEEPVVESYVVKGGNAYEEKVLRLAKSQLRKPYDWPGVIGFGFHQDWADERKRWFCSEFVAWCWHHAGYPLLRVDKDWRISPRDLLMSPLLERIS